MARLGCVWLPGENQWRLGSTIPSLTVGPRLRRPYPSRLRYWHARYGAVTRGCWPPPLHISHGGLGDRIGRIDEESKDSEIFGCGPNGTMEK